MKDPKIQRSVWLSDGRRASGGRSRRTDNPLKSVSKLAATDREYVEITTELVCLRVTLTDRQSVEISSEEATDRQSVEITPERVCLTILQYLQSLPPNLCHV